MYARRLHRQLQPPQSTYIASSNHPTPEHCHLSRRTASPITIATAARTLALPPQSPSATTRTRARGLVSMFKTAKRILIFK
jgi:hypothetical protein